MTLDQNWEVLSKLLGQTIRHPQLLSSMTKWHVLKATWKHWTHMESLRNGCSGLNVRAIVIHDRNNDGTSTMIHRSYYLFARKILRIIRYRMITSTMECVSLKQQDHVWRRMRAYSRLVTYSIRELKEVQTTDEKLKLRWPDANGYHLTINRANNPITIKISSFLSFSS